MNYLFALFSMFLISVHAVAAPPKNSPEMIAQGKKLYETNCLSCHGATGDGMGPAGQYLTPKPRSFSKYEKFTGKKGNTLEGIYDALTNGLKNKKGEQTMMMPFKDVIKSENDRWAVTYYVESLMPKKSKK